MRLIDADTMDFSRMKMPRGNALKAVIDFCDTQPTVSDINKWIPVSERLPQLEISDAVKNGEYTDNGKAFIITDSEGFVYKSTFWAKSQKFNDDAIAWQPLPEPYRP